MSSAASSGPLLLMVDSCAVSLARAWKDDSEILPWLSSWPPPMMMVCALARRPGRPEIRFFGAGFRHRSLQYRKY